jgi:hypothetical protein
MKIKFAILTIVILVLNGCTSTITGNHLIPTPTLTKGIFIPSTSPSPYLLPSPSPSPTFKSIPILGQEDAHQYILGLTRTNASCILPCLWGITPGISTTIDARNVLLPLSGIAEYPDLALNGTGESEFRYPVSEDELMFRIMYFTKSDSLTINALIFSTKAILNNPKPTEKLNFYESNLYQKLVSRYTLNDILSTYGIPSEVIVLVKIYDFEPNTPSIFDLRILYPEKGIFAQYYSILEQKGDNYLGCPSKADISLYLIPSGNGNSYQQILPSISSEWIQYKSPDDYKSNLADVTHMSIENFYQTFKSPTNSCLESPISKWGPN